MPLCFIGKHQEQLVSAICIGREITSLINGNPLIAHGGMALVLTGVIRMKQRGTIMRSVGEELEEVQCAIKEEQVTIVGIGPLRGSRP